jgi:hypothetical protein
MARSPKRIESFDLPPGRWIARKYVVEDLLGQGWEGEVYKVIEKKTGVARAAKVFYPHRNVRDRAVTFYAKKLDRLRRCDIIIQYHNSETFWHHGHRLTCLISEYVDGELLSDFLRRQPGRRLAPFEALHLLYALAAGVEQIHRVPEYHGDLHSDNVIVNRRGIGFEVKLVDLYSWGAPSAANIRDDVVALVHLLYEAVGGRDRYATQPAEIKAICAGLRRDLITRRFRTAGQLRQYLESFDWSS